MAELLSNLLLQLVLLVVGFAQADRAELRASAAEPERAAAVVEHSRREPVGLAADPRPCPGSCDAARMRWQVTLPGPLVRRCGGDCSAG